MTTVDFFCNIFVIYQNHARFSSVLFQVVDTPPMICPFKGVNTSSVKHHIRVFHSLYKVGTNGNFVFKAFNKSKKKLPPVGLDLMLQIITGLGVQYLTI